MAEEGNAVGGKGSEIDFAVMTFLRRAAWPFFVCDFGPFARGDRHYSASIATSRGVGNIGTKRRSSEQEVQRGASTSLFASGASAAEAREALRRVDRTVETAELVRFIVRTQATSALKDTGMTDRAIGAAIGLSKSNINAFSGECQGPCGWALRDEDFELVTKAVSTAWGFPDL